MIDVPREKAIQFGKILEAIRTSHKNTTFDWAQRVEVTEPKYREVEGGERGIPSAQTFEDWSTRFELLEKEDLALRVVGGYPATSRLDAKTLNGGIGELATFTNAELYRPDGRESGILPAIIHAGLSSLRRGIGKIRK